MTGAVAFVRSDQLASLPKRSRMDRNGGFMMSPDVERLNVGAALSIHAKP